MPMFSADAIAAAREKIRLRNEAEGINGGFRDAFLAEYQESGLFAGQPSEAMEHIVNLAHAISADIPAAEKIRRIVGSLSLERHIGMIQGQAFEQERAAGNDPEYPVIPGEGPGQ